MRVFLTGATGFIGSQIARLLVERGDELSVLVRPGSDVRRIAGLLPHLHRIEGDLAAVGSLEAPLRALRPERAFLLAWYAEPGKYLNAVENVDLVGTTVRLAALLAETGCGRLVAAGTCFEYDTDLGTLSESTPLRPRSLYAASKLAAQMMLDQVASRYGTEVAWLRYFYQYGPAEHPNRLVSSVILSLLGGRRAPVTSGEQIRDFLHVADVAGASVAVGGSRLVGPVNIGSGRPVAVRRIVERIGELIGRSDLLGIGDLPSGPSDPKFVCAQTGKLREGTGWEPTFDLDAGLRDTVAWWRAHGPPDRP